MEGIHMKLSAEDFDKAIHGGLDNLPVLPERGDMAVYVKPNATEKGNAMVAVTFTVQLPDGSFARVQAVTTAALFIAAGSAVKGWRDGGHIKAG